MSSSDIRLVLYYFLFIAFVRDLTPDRDRFSAMVLS